MEHSRAALPESTYLARVGEVAYAVAYLEWLILGDLDRLRADLPPELTLETLEPQMTSGIATCVRDAARATTGPIHDYLDACYRALFGAAELRSAVLHGRPATHPDGSQRLSRAEVRNRKTSGHRFWIDDAWLDQAFQKLNDDLQAVVAVRPALGS